MYSFWLFSFFLGSFSSFDLIGCRSWQFLNMASTVHTELIYENLCWWANTRMSISRSPLCGQCPAYLVLLTWIGCEKDGRWSCCNYLLKTASRIFPAFLCSFNLSFYQCSFFKSNWYNHTLVLIRLYIRLPV